MKRVLSNTEVSAALRCQAAWDFRYGSQLAGTSLKPKGDTVPMKAGRAWGRAVAAYHASNGNVGHAFDALEKALADDAAKQQEHGLYKPEEHAELVGDLRAILDFYIKGAELLPSDRLEHELLVPLPSRSGQGRSNRYFLKAYFDALHVDPAGRTWLVEYKIRGDLMTYDQIQKSRQLRQYVWAYRQEYGVDLAGVIVDEALRKAVQPAKWVQSKKKGVGLPRIKFDEKKGKEVEYWIVPSTTAEQFTTPELYIAACNEAGVDVKPETVEGLRSRRWRSRHTVIYSDAEIEEAGKELVSLGRQVAALDSGQTYPVRNVSKANCNGCFFREICNEPDDAELVDVLFDRKPPKRDRPAEPKPTQEKETVNV